MDESFAVRPALDDDAAGLRVEWKESSINVTGRLHYSTEPPPHSSSVMDLGSEQLEVVLVVKLACAV